ncbi:hypothetical protein C4K04_6413 [Pseudomonas chlororaphis]|uniref:Uncharacterized protein n=1 Tax=Pseudomonas chlororaphis TaxID=587753 RepID=A0A3G7TYN7_9PSED|nr:hypothetical protein C4K04_6413 [Pseudomonas chlororaphis]
MQLPLPGYPEENRTTQHPTSKPTVKFSNRSSVQKKQQS